jgi:4-hydroxy-3-polyprenylbenzoate decarboxylase
MVYKSLKDCVSDLEKHGHLVTIKEEVDPYLEMAAIQLRVYEANGPAILFENVKGSCYPAVSNLFGSIDRSRFIFRDTIEKVKALVRLKADPTVVLKAPFSNLWVPFTAIKALPLKQRFGKHLLHTSNQNQRFTSNSTLANGWRSVCDFTRRLHRRFR